VHTINYQGQKKMRSDKNGKPFFVRLPDWKKAYVIFQHPAAAMQAGGTGLPEAGAPAPSLPEGAPAPEQNIAAAVAAARGGEAAGGEAGAGGAAPVAQQPEGAGAAAPAAKQ
jgi:hypothetical protein